MGGGDVASSLAHRRAMPCGRGEFNGSEARPFLLVSPGNQPFLTSINIMNRFELLALQSRQSAIQENKFGRTKMATTRSGGSKRGFAAMDPAKQREIASKGGKASHGGGRKSNSSR